MNLDENDDINFFLTDWNSLPEKTKSKIISEHTNFVILSRRLSNIRGFHSSNFRTLFFTLALCLGMSLLEVDNRTILLTILGVQFFRTIVSQLLEKSLSLIFEESRKSLIENYNKNVKT